MTSDYDILHTKAALIEIWKMWTSDREADLLNKLYSVQFARNAAEISRGLSSA